MKRGKTSSGVIAIRLLRLLVLLLLLPLLFSANISGEPMSRDAEVAALRALDEQMLATAIFMEARGQSPECQAAVGWVVLHRVEKVERKGKFTGIAKECLRKHQFTPLNRGTIAEEYVPCLKEPAAWHDALNLAAMLIANQIYDPCSDIGGADHFHSLNGKSLLPRWAKHVKTQKKIDDITFYRLEGIPYKGGQISQN